MRSRIAALFGAVAAFGLLGSSAPALADNVAAAQKIVDGATRTFKNFVADPDMNWFKANVHRAKALLIVPGQVKGGFIIGGSGGTGVLISRQAESNVWSYPAFYNLGSASIGFQFGGEKSEVVLMIMTEAGMHAFLSTKFQLGADAKVAAGPVGTGAQAATADVLAFSRSKGVFGGVSGEGTVIKISDKLNHAYYGAGISPVEILVEREVQNPAAADLLTVATAGGG